MVCRNAAGFRSFRFLKLGIGFVVGPMKVAGFNLGNVTATLLAGMAIGQLGIELSGDLKSTLFLLFLFAVGYGVGPQFVRGLAKDGPKQIAFALSVLVLCLAVPYVSALIAGLPLGYGRWTLRGLTDHLRGHWCGDRPDQFSRHPGG